jgi:hypothetical protein
MTLDEVMKQYSGEWNAEGYAVVQLPDGYYWRIAKKDGDTIELTDDGKYVAGIKEVANTSTSKVESPKKGKKPAAPVADDLDDLDI